ncbi:MAG: nucleotidyltransferase domain-containing protein [Cyanobacteria bacterium SIG28]|nr:nucleotidyltransferase domain-containing protein [Cyanobacteria bacterium SIG28]
MICAIIQKRGIAVFDINVWLDIIIKKLQNEFEQRLLFVGLQGSYNRGEATPNSDIDIVVILENLSFEDLKRYRSIIDSMPDKDKSCGFISGREELQNWSKSDLFQFFYDTKSLIGNLQDLIQAPTIEDATQAVKISSENLYHTSVHSFVHSNNYVEDLQNLYKSTFFILQAKYFKESGKYISTQKQLLEMLNGIDRDILNICINRNNINEKATIELENLYKMLIQWSSDNIKMFS